MNKAGRSFSDVLLEAQAKGYAETPPDLDVDGYDTAHKLAIITSLAFGCTVNAKAMHIEGIRCISPRDFEYAKALGYTIRLLGVTEEHHGEVLQRVHPCLVKLSSPFAMIEGVLNATLIECSDAGNVLLTGAGAGGSATASSVIADVLDIVRGNAVVSCGVPTNTWHTKRYQTIKQHQCEHYIRLQVIDKSGVLAQITSRLSKADIGVENVLHRTDEATGTAHLAITTHPVLESAVQKVLEAIEKLDYVVEKPIHIRIEE